VDPIKRGKGEKVAKGGGAFVEGGPPNREKRDAGTPSVSGGKEG